MGSEKPQADAYSPYQAARRPVTKPGKAPRFRVLVHRKHANLWAQLAERCGDQNAQRVWDHLAYQPDQAPPIGQCTPMKGKYGRADAEGWSRVYHYEVSGAGRIDYQFHAEYQGGKLGDPHPVVRIIGINLSSH